MLQSRKGALIFLFIILMAFLIGSYILTATFFGVITLVGLIALIESIPILRWLASKSTKTIDVIIFVCTIFATMNYGLNIAASLTVAGIGYTLVYAPYLRENEIVVRVKNTKKRSSNRPKFDRR